MKKKLTCWWVYIVQCSDGSLYAGCAVDLVKRISVHNQGKGAKYTRSRLPVHLVYSTPYPDRSTALKQELLIKKMSRSQKLALIAAEADRIQDEASIV